MDLPGRGTVETWVELAGVSWPLVSFRTRFVFSSDGAAATSTSTVRFWEADELTASLTAADLVVETIRDAPDRPGQEMVFVARKPASTD